MSISSGHLIIISIGSIAALISLSCSVAYTKVQNKRLRSQRLTQGSVSIVLGEDIMDFKASREVINEVIHILRTNRQQGPAKSSKVSEKQSALRARRSGSLKRR